MSNGRWRLCECIAKTYPFSVQEIYDVYEFLREQQKVKPVTLAKQLDSVHKVLYLARDLAISPMRAAQHQLHTDDVRAPCKKHNIEFCVECFPVVLIDTTSPVS